MEEECAYAGREIHPSWFAVLTDPVRLAILHSLYELDGATAVELRERIHTSDRTLRRHLAALTALGLVEERHGSRDGITPGRPASRFTIAGQAKTRVARLFSALSEPPAP